jgi:hypothetical protein
MSGSQRDDSISAEHDFLMSDRRNVPESIRARLLNLSRDRHEDFNLTLSRYVAERFLYRLGQSAFRERHVLKGAMLLTVAG